MKKYIYLLFSSVWLWSASFCQEIRPADIEDSVLGWIKIYNPKGAKVPLKQDGRVFSVAQLSIADSFVRWMQASYVPKGALGDVMIALSDKLHLYNQSSAAEPQAYGAVAKIYVMLKYDSKGKIVPLTSDHIPWSIVANGIVGIRAQIFCTPTQYYFTLPSFGEQGYNEEITKPYGLTTDPRLKKYMTYFQRDSKFGNRKTVMLFRDNKSPFVPITKGEYLQITEQGIYREYENEKKKIYETEKGNQRGLDYFMKYLNEKHAKRLECLKNNKERYKDRLQEKATIWTDQPSIMLENFPDVFEGNGGSSHKLPVYKIDSVAKELCKSDKPQWIRITWHGDVFDPVGKHQHESIINNFDFDYVYSFFFEPEKVKGKPYKPLRSPTYEEAVVIVAASEKSKAMGAEKSIFYYEDFSTTVVGKKPIGWHTKLSFKGTTSIITTREGLQGNWVELTGGQTIISTQLKKPLPQDFTLSYDLIASQNFTWGAKGLIFQLAKETSQGNAESYLQVRLRPGFDGREGETTIEAKFPFPPGYMNETKWTKAPGFSNNKKNNKVTVTIKKSGEMLQLFIDNVKMAEYTKAIPAAHLFNAMWFQMGGETNEVDRYYVSNIKIEKN